ncbi:MAG: autotransporter domain-containing protein [Opitutales bacterium]|nr:autotransporter domain-containing protein [Opitutales bacterium]
MKQFISKSTIGCGLAVFAGIANAQYTEELASSFDLRDVNGYNYLSPVQNQGNFGACYSFGATAAAESTYNRAMGLYNENSANFSESYIIWYLGQFYDGFGGEGANYDYDELQALVDYGIIDDSEFPYVITDPGEGNYHTDAETVTFSSWHRVASYDVQTMKYVIQNIGALDVGILATDAFSGYEAGDDAFNQYTMQGYQGIVDYRSIANHSVALVGWDNSKGTNGSWILRNSWGSAWGEEGYMHMSYNSSNVSTSATYLVYGDWTGENFTLVNDENIVSVEENDIGSYTENGIYEWGGNDASITNNADITIIQEAADGDAVAKGITLWAGDNASVENNGSIYVGCNARNGISTAYGMLSQGHSLTNTGEVSAVALGRELASAYGARFLSYDKTGVFSNTGTIKSEVNYGKAYGVHINDAASVTNTGLIDSIGYYYSIGLSANDVGNAINEGDISSESNLGYSIAAYIDTCESFTNSGTITAKSTRGTAYGIYAIKTNIINSGTISALADNNKTEGVYITDSTLLNSGTITGYYNDFIDSVVTNNGSIITENYSYFENSTLQGNGTYVGDISASNTILSPGNSVGTIHIDGDADFYDGVTVNIEMNDGDIDKIVVTGSLHVEGNAEVNFSASGYIPSGDYAFVEAGDFDYSDITSYSLNGFYLMFENSTFSYDNSSVKLNIERHSYSDFVKSASIMQMADTLDKVRTTASGNLAYILNTIDFMDTSAEIGAAVSEFFPAINLTTGYAVMQDLHNNDDILIRHSKNICFSKENRYIGWLNYSHNNESVTSFKEIPAYDSESHTTLVGVDYMVNSNWSAGLAFGKNKQTIETASSKDGSDARGNHFYLTGSWDQHPDKNGFYATASIGRGSITVNTEREMALVSGNLKSHHKADSTSAAVSGGYDYNRGILTIRPYASVKWAKLSEDAYSEDERSGVEMSFKQTQNESLQGSIALSIGANFTVNKIMLIPEIHAEYSTELDNSADDIYVQFSDGNGFTTASRELSDNTTRLGCSLGVLITERTLFNVSYDHIEYNNYDDKSNRISTALHVSF